MLPSGRFMRLRHTTPMIFFLSLSLLSISFPYRSPPSKMLPRIHPRRRDPRRHRHRLARDLVRRRIHRRAMDLEASGVRPRMRPALIVHVADLRAVRRGDERRRAHEAHLLPRAGPHRPRREGGQRAPRRGARPGWQVARRVGRGVRVGQVGRVRVLEGRGARRHGLRAARGGGAGAPGHGRGVCVLGEGHGAGGGDLGFLDLGLGAETHGCGGGGGECGKCLGGDSKRLARLFCGWIGWEGVLDAVL